MPADLTALIEFGAAAVQGVSPADDASSWRTCGRFRSTPLRQVLTRVSRAGWRLEQAERERTWALVPARAEGISIRTLAAAVGLSPSRVHQLVAAADREALDAALGELRAGQPRKIPVPGRTPSGPEAPRYTDNPFRPR